MFSLEEIRTKDGLIHQGLVAYPKKSQDTVIIWVHGLTGDFYSNTSLLNTFAKELTTNGITFATFNNRGHDMITGFRKIDPSDPKGYTYATIGAGHEVFEECVYDIDAAIQFFVEKGYKKIILSGHSSGANKVCYYSGTVKNPNIAGIVLMCPMSDRLDPSVNPEAIDGHVKKCLFLIEQGRGDAIVTDVSFFPMTAKRYISLVTRNSPEDQFGYGDIPPNMDEYENITIPLCVLFAEQDEHADRPITDIKRVFDTLQKSRLYTSYIIPSVFHNLAGKETLVLDQICNWLKKIA